MNKSQETSDLHSEPDSPLPTTQRRQLFPPPPTPQPTPNIKRCNPRKLTILKYILAALFIISLMYLVSTLGSKQSDTTLITEPQIETEQDENKTLSLNIKEQIKKDINHIQSSVITHTKIYVPKFPQKQNNKNNTEKNKITNTSVPQKQKQTIKQNDKQLQIQDNNQNINTISQLISITSNNANKYSNTQQTTQNNQIHSETSSPSISPINKQITPSTTFTTLSNHISSKRQKVHLKKTPPTTISNNPQQKYKIAVEYFNPWDLSTQTKQTLLKKFSKMPLINSSETKSMPILQKQESQLQPLLAQLQQYMEVIDYPSLTMSNQQQKKYSLQFQNKLYARLVIKQRQLQNQAYFGINLTDIYSQVSQIRNYQWYQSFQYRTLAGIDITTNQYAKTIADKQRHRFEQKYNTNHYKNQIGMCVIIPSYQNQDLDRYLWNIQSVLQQEYTNYRVVILDDASTDKTSQLLAQHLKWRNLNKNKVILIKTKKNMKSITNIFYGTHKYCKMGQIQYVIDGDDQLIGRQVFKVMNAVYQKQKYLTVYSNHIVASFYQNAPIQYLGISRNYWPHDIENNNFRKTKNRGYHHLRTMMTDTILLMRPESFKDWRGEFYWTIGDNAVYYPAMEMSCKKVKYINEIFYLYNYNTGLSDDIKKLSKNQDYDMVFDHINNQKPYRCLALDFLQIYYAAEQ